MSDHNQDKHRSWSVGRLNSAILTLVESVIANGMVAVVADGAKIDTGNSSTTPLGIGGVFPGVWTDTLGYSAIIVGVRADQESAADGLHIIWSADGVSEHDHDQFTIDANTGKTFNFQPAWRYVKVEYTNGAVAQTSFELQTQLKKTAVRGSAHRIAESISGEDDAELIKAVLTGLAPAGDFRNVLVTNAGGMKISVEEFETAVSTNSNTQLKTTVYSEAGDAVGVDSTTGGILTVDYNHHEIHSGSHYFVIDAAELAINEVFDLTFQTPDTAKWSHFVFSLDVTGETEWFVYEGATATNPLANAITPRNNNRNSANTSGNTLKSELQANLAAANADTSVGGATEIMHGILGAGRNGGNIERGSEVILKQNTLYCMRAIANAGTIIAFKMEWYEHTN